VCICIVYITHIYYIVKDKLLCSYSLAQNILQKMVKIILDNFKVLVQNTFKRTFIQHMSPHLYFSEEILCYKFSQACVF